MAASAAFSWSCSSDSQQSNGSEAVPTSDDNQEAQAPVFRALPGDGVDSPVDTSPEQPRGGPRGSNDIEYDDFLDTASNLRNSFSGAGGSSFVSASAPTTEQDAGSDASFPAVEPIDAGTE